MIQPCEKCTIHLPLLNFNFLIKYGLLTLWVPHYVYNIIRYVAILNLAVYIVQYTQFIHDIEVYTYKYSCLNGRFSKFKPST